MQKTAIIHQKSTLSENNRIMKPFVFRKKIVKFNYLHPSEILACKWTKANQPDEIVYRAFNGQIYTIIDENLLEELTEYMNKNNLHGTLPHIHIKGSTSVNCFEKPQYPHIVSFIKKYFDYYDIYDTEGNTVKSSSKKDRNILITDIDE
jgi:hypothetical protein